jgi:hypothetical protein
MPTASWASCSTSRGAIGRRRHGRVATFAPIFLADGVLFALTVLIGL